MSIFRWKKVVDEREEMEMMRVEHYMFWFAFWALLVSIFVQLLAMRASFLQVAGEWIVFMLMAVGTVIGELKGGHFDYISRPGIRSYLKYSAVAAVASMGVVLIRGIEGGYYQKPLDAVLSLLISGIFTAGLTFLCLAAAGAFVKRRRRKLEKEFEEEDED